MDMPVRASRRIATCRSIIDIDIDIYLDLDLDRLASDPPMLASDQVAPKLPDI
ncbi:hypothetical protein [Phytohabitans houttuyneae]|uniref:Uncharacterized protein n=1 Tax=Phytohabitans houttuyneae TaxID=1076126 RepID=A0A6V8JXH4_9ACTN|nr:hypothetical protein [Phytohabitans houttuyneae]GFJ77422.1 hypothetical protein Phou_016020 [Phytohabitans houttuyneae]